ncbi:AmpG family muropeptide MFS transporter [Pseudanabaena sp. PCC 6802]|uniref:AmpG family muropeptide MFS transporter n=1 Tax=Pseudanabaena sp. PCC 6802 TaxID=118173 RepID=UPI00034CDAE1|nr:AmpG family muropeptide MFS transporter [Pseudanabaena sp. PCC 6802]
MKATKSLLQVFGSRKMASLMLLGVASGLPFALTDDAFRAWLSNKAGFDLSTIGWLGLVSLPYSLKFLWSPFTDRFVPPFLGRRRGWILCTQVLLVVAIVAIAFQMFAIENLPKPERLNALPLLAVTALSIAFLSATQDIAIDAYRADVLEVKEVGAGVGIWVMGYRVALLLTGFIGFNLADHIGWSWVYAFMALLMGLNIWVTFAAPEPKVDPNSVPTSLDAAVIKPFQEFLRRIGLRNVLFILIFVIFYRFSDAMVSKMAVPFLGAKGLGFSDGDIGTVRQGLGLFATIVGTLAGGAILSKIGVNRSLWIFGILQAVSNLGYYLLALVGKDYTALVLAINVENFCSGLGTAGFLGYLITLCNPSFSATQYALLSSLFAVGRDVLAAPFAGELAQFIQKQMPTWTNINQIPWLVGSDGKGWALFFLITVVLALPGMALLPFFAPWHEVNLVGELPEDP